MKTAKSRAPCSPITDDVNNLQRALKLFSQSTRRLEGSYQTLKEKFHRVEEQLKEANKELHCKMAELNTTTRYLDNILCNMTQGILFIRLNGLIITYNRAAERFLKIPKEKVMEKSFWNYFSDCFFGFSMKEALTLQRSLPLCYIDSNDLNNRACTYEVSGNFVFDEDESHRGLILVIRDISETRRWQILANRNDRMKALGEMAAALAHEIRNPLGGIKGFAALLQRDLSDYESLQKMAKNILTGVDTLDSLVNRVLQYARPLTLKRKSTDLTQLIQEIAALLRADSQYSSKKVDFLLSSSDAFFLSIDPILFRSVFLNLFTNALHALPKSGGKIAISLYKEKTEAVITVTDNGKGISKQNREKIFSPFFTTKHNGNGLGLAETHKIIRAHGGETDVVSTLNKGTTFTIKLPQKEIEE